VVVSRTEARGNVQYDRHHYSRTGGGVFSEVREAGPEEAKVFALAAFHDIVIRDKVSPKNAHNALLKIDEFRDGIAPDLTHPVH